MFYCPQCNNMYGITKNPPTINNTTEQTGGKHSESETPTSVSMSDSSLNNTIDYESTVTKILQNEFNDETTFNFIENITKTNAYKKLSSKDKVFIKNKLMELLPKADKIKIMETNTVKTTNEVYFICNYCGYSEKIEPGTLVMSRLSTEGTHDFTDNTQYKNMIHVKTLPLTRNYICPNKTCVSQKNHEKREAVFFRTDGQYRIRYVCKACETSWI